MHSGLQQRQGARRAQQGAGSAQLSASSTGAQGRIASFLCPSRVQHAGCLALAACWAAPAPPHTPATTLALPAAADEVSLLAALWVLESANDSRRCAASTVLVRYTKLVGAFFPQVCRLRCPVLCLLGVPAIPMRCAASAALPQSESALAACAALDARQVKADGVLPS